MDWHTCYDGPPLRAGREWEAACGPTAYNVGFVYLLGSDSELLYVGQAWNVWRRIEKHRRLKPWWPLVSTVTVVRIAALDRDSMRADVDRFERGAIRDLNPSKNVSRPKVATA